MKCFNFSCIKVLEHFFPYMEGVLYGTVTSNMLNYESESAYTLIEQAENLRTASPYPELGHR